MGVRVYGGFRPFKRCPRSLGSDAFSEGSVQGWKRGLRWAATTPLLSELLVEDLKRLGVGPVAFLLHGV